MGESLRRSGEGDPCPSNLDFQLIGAQLWEQQEEEEELEFLLQGEKKKERESTIHPEEELKKKTLHLLLIHSGKFHDPVRIFLHF